MQIQTLKLLNFRIYSSLELAFSKKMNIFYGKNGSGKTNIVEAIYFLALTKSFRNGNDSNVIQHSKEVCKIEANIMENSLINYKIIVKNSGKMAKIDNNSVTKLSEYISKINVVVFQNDDLKLIKDTPSVRRKILNIGLSQTSLKYMQDLSKYNKLIKQRNSYLKMLYVSSNESIEYLKILNEKIVDIGLNIYKARKEKIEYINEKINKYLKIFSDDKEVSVEYISDYHNLNRSEILKKMDDLISRDMFIKKTSFGVHHDDIVFNLDGNSMKNFSSEGQQKNAVIAYKFVEIDWIKDKKKAQPILILDDLFGELDKEKIENILNNLDGDIQTFITTTEIENINKDIISKARLFYIEDGRVEEREV